MSSNPATFQPSGCELWDSDCVTEACDNLDAAGVCPPDETTYDYVQQRTDEPFEAQFADEGAGYIEEYRFDVSKIEPLVAAPHSPDNRKNARDCRDVKIDRVYIG